MRRKSLLAGAIALALAATGVGINAQSASAAGTTITIWHNLGTTQNAEAVKALGAKVSKALPQGVVDRALDSSIDAPDN